MVRTCSYSDCAAEATVLCSCNYLLCGTHGNYHGNSGHSVSSPYVGLNPWELQSIAEVIPVLSHKRAIAVQTAIAGARAEIESILRQIGERQQALSCLLSKIVINANLLEQTLRACSFNGGVDKLASDQYSGQLIAWKECEHRHISKDDLLRLADEALNLPADLLKRSTSSSRSDDADERRRGHPRLGFPTAS